MQSAGPLSSCGRGLCRSEESREHSGVYVVATTGWPDTVLTQELIIQSVSDTAANMHWWHTKTECTHRSDSLHCPPPLNWNTETPKYPHMYLSVMSIMTEEGIMAACSGNPSPVIYIIPLFAPTMQTSQSPPGTFVDIVPFYIHCDASYPPICAHTW